MKHIGNVFVKVVIILLFVGCHTVYDNVEPDYPEEKVVLGYNDSIDVEVHLKEIGNNFVKIEFSALVEGDFSLNGVRMFSFGKRAQLTINDLQPQTHYAAQLRIIDGGLLYPMDFEFDTKPSFLHRIGVQEMNLEYDETSITQIEMLDDGDMIELLSNNLLRRVSAEGIVKWRAPVEAEKINLGQNGRVVAIHYGYVSVVDVDKGNVLYVGRPSDSKVMVEDASVGADGTLVAVGSRHYTPEEANYYKGLMATWRRKYYIGHFNTAGHILSEQFKGTAQANSLYSVVALPSGGYSALGYSADTLRCLTLNAECNIVTNTVHVHPYRDFEYWFTVRKGCTDLQGNVYYFGGAQVNYNWSRGIFFFIKVNPQGGIEWMRNYQCFGCEYRSDEFLVPCVEPLIMRVVSDHIVAFTCDDYEHYSPSCEYLYVFDSDGDLVVGKNIDFEVRIRSFVVNDDSFSDFLLFNKYGEIYRLQLDGYLSRTKPFASVADFMDD